MKNRFIINIHIYKYLLFEARENGKNRKNGKNRNNYHRTS